MKAFLGLLEESGPLGVFIIAALLWLFIGAGLALACVGWVQNVGLLLTVIACLAISIALRWRAKTNERKELEME